MAASRLCSIPNCGNAVFGHGWCSKHYQRWRRNGDPLAGRVDNGVTALWIADALAFAGESCLMWPYAVNDGGYGIVNVDGRTHVVSRYICEKAHGAPPETGHDAAHSCNTRLCGNPKHVSWKTREGNMADAIEAGTIVRGEENHFSKLKADEVRRIFSLKGIMPAADIADLFDVSFSCVTAIHRQERWKWLTQDPSPL